MADLSRLSDEELEAAISSKKSKKAAGLPAKDLTVIPDEDLEVMIAAKKDPSLLETLGEVGGQAADKALQGIGFVGKQIDKYTGAPTRAAIGSLQNELDPVKAAQAFGSQFGEDPELAPTGKEIAQKGGVPDTALSEKFPQAFSESGEGLPFKKGGPADITASGAAGLAVDIGADPTNVLPIGKIAKGLGMAGEGIGKGLIKAGLKVAPEGVRVAAKTTEEAFRNTARAMGRFVNNKVRPEYEASVITAMKNNIDPAVLNSSVKYGKESSIARLERGMTQRPAGDKYLEQYSRGVNEIQDAFDRKVSGIAGSDVKNITQADAGNLLKEGYGAARKNFFDQMDFTYRTVGSQAPDMPLAMESIDQLKSSLQPIVSEAERRAKNAALSPGSRAQAQQVIEVARGIENQAVQGKYMDLVDGLQDLGDAFGSGSKGAGDIPPDIAAYRRMYKGVKDSLVTTVRKNLGDDIANGLVKNNEAMSNWFENSAKGIEDVIEKSGQSPEQVFRQIVETGDTNRLKAIKNALEKDPSGAGQELLGKIKGAYVENLKVLDEEGKFSFARMRNKFMNDEKTSRVLRELFSPEEIKDMQDIIKLGEDMGPVKLNPSGTQEFKLFSEPLKSIGQTVENEGVLNYLKSRAELGDVPMEMSGPELLKKIQESKSAGPLPPESFFKKGKVETGLKGAQVIAVDRYDDSPDFVEVPPDMVPGITTKLLKAKITNTEKAKVLRKLQNDGEISQEVLDLLSQ